MSRIRPELLGRPVRDIEALRRDALTLLNTGEVAARPDLEPTAQAVAMVVGWLTGADDLGVDRSIPCPPRDRADIQRQRQAVYDLFRRIGAEDEQASVLVHAVWRVLRYIADPQEAYPLDRRLYRAA